MIQAGDGIMIALIVVVLAVWLWIYLRSRMERTLEQEPLHSYLKGEAPARNEVTRLLESRGYQIVTGKTKIPLEIVRNGAETLQSRLFLDYVVKLDSMHYAVKLARERMPLEMTGSALRDKLLVYQLILPGLAGVLYVDMSAGTIHCFEFHVVEDT